MNIKAVKHPDHYTAGRKFEPKDVIRDWGLNFNLGSAVKYIARAGRKDDIIQDLSKAKEYIDFEIEALTPDRNATAEKASCRLFEELNTVPLPTGRTLIGIVCEHEAEAKEIVRRLNMMGGVEK